uniref:Si:dkey-234h16.7 n=1 Tax=Paramormyrops kingsleyae TaxID=1676925 RepID=A0A3B3QWM3_9TELE
ISFCLCAKGQQAESKTNERPFMVLQNQNLLLVSVLSVIVLVMVIMAVCVYKPLRRR